MIPIFTQEITDGVAEQVRSSASIAIASEIKIIDQTEQQKLDLLATFAQEANPNQFDLFYLESILVSTGWNQNDDVFDPFEAWKARSTPVDKQFNFMHNEKDIIGHITSSRVVSLDGAIIPDNAAFDVLPTSFDIVVGSVLYKIWSDTELQNRMNSIIEGISKGRWFVSMECLFRNFDYAIITPTGEQKIVARNESTAFLTKYLRWYGGPGVYEDHKVGRLLRDFGFSGKGLVDKPANKRSLFLSFNNDKEVISFASANIEDNFLSTKENLMANEDTVTKVQYDELKAEFDKLKASIDEQNTKKVAELESSVANLNTELTASKEVIAAKDDKVAKLEASLEDTKKALEDAQAEITKMKIEGVKAARLASLLTREISEDKARDLVEKFVSVSDEMFASLLDSLPIKEEAKCGDTKKEDAKCGDKKKDEAECVDPEDEEEDKCEGSEDTMAVENTASLDSVEATEDIELNVGNQEVETVAAKAAAWFSEHILKTTAKKKE